MEIDSDFALAELGSSLLRLAIKGDLIRGELDDGANIPRLPPERIGASVSWTNDSWHISGSVQDAADQTRAGDNEEIRLSTSFLRDVAPEPGRSIEAGVRFVF